ncbi:hypothetical protein D1AOALGA4SA_995 [Olavius algarvensis Delta 1 endosymbiont]|nr:hypothetical protein D1AOALGA4SA_995 [Olavius algarvensis Delta 1 endosymbiont]
MVQGSEVQGLGFRVQGLGFRVQGLGMLIRCAQSIIYFFSANFAALR